MLDELWQELDNDICFGYVAARRPLRPDQIAFLKAESTRMKIALSDRSSSHTIGQKAC